jgi:hypothetical protein
MAGVERLEHGAHEAASGLKPRPAPATAAATAAAPDLAAALEQADQLVAVAVVVVERADRDPGAAADGGQRRGGQAALGDLGLGGVEDGLGDGGAQLPAQRRASAR